MSSTDEDLAIRLTTLIVATRGVHGIFPHSVVAAAAAAFIGSDRKATGIVTLNRAPGHIDITARIAIDSAVPATEVATHLHDALRHNLGTQPFALHLEVAHLV